MGRITSAALCSMFALGPVGPAIGQTSLFGQPLGQPPAAAPAPEAAAPAEGARPRPKPKPRGPTPARSLSISNASSSALTSLEISAEGKSGRLAQPLAPNGRTTVKLPAFKRCVVSVTASFEAAGEAEASDYNICREKSIRFTD